MTWKKLFLNFIAISIIVVMILTIGPWFSKKQDEKYRRKIDQRGVEVRGIITGKRQFKGREIHFRYNYNGKNFTNYEDSKFYYHLEAGDSVIIKIDQDTPGNSYIVGN